MRLKEMLKQNKISISLFVILFMALIFFFFMLPATTCESLFLGEKFELDTFWFLPIDIADTTMRITTPEYERCIVTAPIIFIVLFIIITYIVASLIAYWYKREK